MPSHLGADSGREDCEQVHKRWYTDDGDVPDTDAIELIKKALVGWTHAEPRENWTVVRVELSAFKDETCEFDAETFWHPVPPNKRPYAKQDGLVLEDGNAANAEKFTDRLKAVRCKRTDEQRESERQTKRARTDGGAAASDTVGGTHHFCITTFSSYVYILCLQKW